MFVDNLDVFYYLTLYNENYPMPPMPAGVEDGILRGIYLFRKGEGSGRSRVTLLGSGPILMQVLRTQEMLQEKYDIAADVYSVTSYQQLRNEALEVERWNRLHPTEPQRRAYVEECLAGRKGPAIASTDYIRTFADQIRPFVPGRYVALGTDGFGRSDYRVALRRFFEVDRHHVAVAALKALADEGAIESSVVASAIERYGVDADAAPPWKR